MDNSDRRARLLEIIQQAVCQDRMASYGDAEDNFINIAALWNIIFKDKLSSPFDALDVANACVQIKEARKMSAAGRTHLDNYIDGAGYSVCGGGIVDSWQSMPVSKPRHDPLKLDAEKFLGREPRTGRRKVTLTLAEYQAMEFEDSDTDYIIINPASPVEDARDAPLR